MQKLISEEAQQEFFVMYDRVKNLEKELLHSNQLFFLELENRLSQKLDRRIILVFENLLPNIIQQSLIANQKQQNTVDISSQIKQIVEISQDSLQKSEENYQTIRNILSENKSQLDNYSSHLFTQQVNSKEEKISNYLVNNQNELQSKFKSFQDAFSQTMKEININYEVFQHKISEQKQQIATLENSLWSQIDKLEEKNAHFFNKIQALLDEKDNKNRQTEQDNPNTVHQIKNYQQENTSQYTVSANFTNPPPLQSQKFIEFNKYKPIPQIQKFINSLYNQTSRLRNVPQNQQMFIQNAQNLNEFCQYYQITKKEQIFQISHLCKGFRRVRGDGNCFYTAFGFQVLLILLTKYDDVQFSEFINQLWNLTTNIGFEIRYNQNSIKTASLGQNLYKEFLQRILNFRNNIDGVQDREYIFTKHFQQYEQDLNDDLNDGCLYGLSCIFFRNLANYLVQNSELKDSIYDKETLLEWEKECNCNEVIIAILSEFFTIQSTLIFFKSQNFIHRVYNEKGNHKIILLIQPGHYNIGLNE